MDANSDNWNSPKYRKWSCIWFGAHSMSAPTLFSPTPPSSLPMRPVCLFSSRAISLRSCINPRPFQGRCNHNESLSFLSERARRRGRDTELLPDELRSLRAACRGINYIIIDWCIFLNKWRGSSQVANTVCVRDKCIRPQTCSCLQPSTIIAKAR